MDIPRYRIGNDLTVLWAICNNDGTPFDLSGKVVRLFVTNDKGITEVKPTITSDKDGSANNVILWNYLGDDQKVLGKHTLTVEILTSDDKRKIKRDVCDAFTLVSRSESEETGGDANFMDSGSIYLSTKLDVYRFGNVRVEIGTNGNWFIDGYDTGKTALGGGPGLVNIIYKESDLGGEFQPDSVIDTFNANAINAIYKALKAISLKDINNISLANLAAYDVLTYNGSNWINLPFKDLINLFRGPSESGSDTPVSGDSYWILGEDGKLYSNYDIYVRGNAVIEGDTSSGGSGQDTPSAGGSLSNLSDVSLSSLSEGDVLVYDKGNNVWYNVPQSKIMPNLEGYAKESDLDALQAEVDNIDAVLGLSETAEGYINTWAEVVAFLDAIEQEKDLASILETMNTNIGKNATDIESLTTRVEAEEGVTETYKTWWADLKKYIKVENGNVKVDTNLIITGDTSSGGSGQDTPASGTVTGIKVSASETLTPNNAGIIDMVSVLSSIDVSDQLKDYAKLTDITKNMVDSVLGSTAAGNANRFLMSTGSTSVWAAISKDMVTSALGYTPLSTGGGTIDGTTSSPLKLNTSSTTIGIPLSVSNSEKAWFGWSAGQGAYLWNANANKYLGIKEDGTPHYNGNTLIHSGNIGSYAPLRKTRQSTIDLNAASNGYYEVGYSTQTATNTPSDFGNNASLLIDFRDANGYGKIQFLGQNNTNKLWFRAQQGAGADITSAWKTIAFTDSTVAAAKKLVTSGGTNLVYSDSSSYFVAGLHDYSTYIDGKTIYLRYSASGIGMVMNSSGNVTIGATDLASTTTKLYVDGGIRFAPRTIWGQSFDGTGNVSGALSGVTYLTLSGTTFGIYQGNTLNSALTSNDIALYSQKVYMGGNVLIGTMTDSGYKLDVAGTGRFTGAVTMSSTLSVGGNCYLSGMSMIYQSDNAYRLTSYTSENYARIYNIKEDGSSYGSMYIGQNSTGAIVILNGSYVGIGTTPSGNYKFQVSGNSYLGGSLHVSTTIKAVTSVTTPLLKSEGGLDIVANNSGAGARLYLTTNVFRPWGDDSKLIDLGASNIQWRNVYAVNAVFSGDTSSGSDIRFKDIIKNKTIKIADIAKAPLFTFKWNDREDDTIHLGSSAQYWEKVTPWLVKGEDFKTLDYATLGVAMGISLAKKAVNHEERIKALEKEIKRLKEEMIHG